MDIKDLIVTPLVLILIILMAYILRPYFTNAQTKKFFISALVFKMIGAISIGLIYQFYYDRGGDTFAYYNQSKQIHAAFYENPITGMKLLLNSGGNYYEITDNDPDTYKYTSKMRFFKGKSEYFVIRLSALFGLFCFHTYTSIALCFAVLSFISMWMAYKSFLRLYPNLRLGFAIAFLFIPSTIIWGSGIFKDTIVLSAVAWAFISIIWLFEGKKKIVLSLTVLALALYVVFMVKLYVLFALLPSLVLWMVLHYKNRITNPIVRISLAPILISIGMIFAYLSVESVAANDRRFSLDQIGERTRINAEYLYYMSNKSQGSGYYLGTMDGSISSMLTLTPAAINVTLFRPYIWEVKNPLMLLSSLESVFFIILTLSVFFRPGLTKAFKTATKDEVIIVFFVFTFILSAAVGLNSYNFGTLSRYKIALLPFYIAGLFILRNSINLPKRRLS